MKYHVLKCLPFKEMKTYIWLQSLPNESWELKDISSHPRGVHTQRQGASVLQALPLKVWDLLAWASVSYLSYNSQPGPSSLVLLQGKSTWVQVAHPKEQELSFPLERQRKGSQWIHTLQLTFRDLVFDHSPSVLCSSHSVLIIVPSLAVLLIHKEPTIVIRTLPTPKIPILRQGVLPLTPIWKIFHLPKYTASGVETHVNINIPFYPTHRDSKLVLWFCSLQLGSHLTVNGLFPYGQ